MADEEGRVNGEVEFQGTDLNGEKTRDETTPTESEQADRRANEKEEVTKQENGSEEQNKVNTEAGEEAAKEEDQTNVDRSEVQADTSEEEKKEDESVEEKKEDQQDVVQGTNEEEVTERRQETEVDTEARESMTVQSSGLRIVGARLLAADGTEEYVASFQAPPTSPYPPRSDLEGYFTPSHASFNPLIGMTPNDVTINNPNLTPVTNNNSRDCGGVGSEGFNITNNSLIEKTHVAPLNNTNNIGNSAHENTFGDITNSRPKSWTSLTQSSTFYEKLTSRQQKVTTSESSHTESSVETTAPVQIASGETEARADQSEENKEQEETPATQSEEAQTKEFEPELQPKPQPELQPEPQPELQPEPQPEPQPESQPEDKGNEKPADSEEKEEKTNAEISEPDIKAQLQETIKEIDDVIVNEDVAQELREEEQKEQKEQEEQEEHEDQVYHTWRPKGKYEVDPTPIMREDVVPIDVADVPEPPPIEQPPLLATTDAQESSNDTSRTRYQDHVGPITVPQLLPNGELGSPIEIPEGIPLLARILPKEEGSDREKIPLERLFTPATDSGDITPRKKKAFASSDFYAPNHPTIDDQLQLAQNISKSLIDQNNKTSRGQAMYEKRKQRSVKWIHQAQGSEFLETNDVQPKTSKPAMKLVMNPKGVQDHTTVEQHYQQLMEQSNMSSSNMSPGVPASPEMVRDIITDMQSPTGKGAALFAKRKKRMDKFIVDETNVQKSSAYQQEQQSFVQNTTTEKSTVNQFSSFSSSTSSSSSSSTNQQKPGVLASSIPVSNKKKSLQARDEEQQRIMAEFLKNRESQFQIVKTPWEAVLETGNTSAAFKQNMQTKSSFSSTISAVSGPALPGGAAAPPPWLEMPQPVPVTAPLPKSAPSVPLPTPPSPFAAYTAGHAANGPLNNPTSLPDLSNILTSSSAKSKSLTPQPSSVAAAKPSGLNVKPALAIDNNRASNLLSKSTARSPRSSSVGKPQEKRLSTLPNAAKYPFPSYLNIASKPTGYLRSSSASSISALAEAFANDPSMAAKSTDDLTETFPFLKPGTPPILVVPGVEGESTTLGNGLTDEIPSWIAQVETKKVAQQQPPDFTTEVKLRKVKSRETTSRIASGSVNSVDAQNGTENLLNHQNASASSTSVNFNSSIAAASSSYLPSYNFVSKVPAEKEELQSSAKNDEKSDTSASTSLFTRSSQLSAPSTTSNPHSFCSVAPTIRSAPAYVGIDSSSVGAFSNRGSASVLTNTRQLFLENTSNFLQSSESSVDIIEQKNMSAPSHKPTQKSVFEPSDGHSSSAFQVFQNFDSKDQGKIVKNSPEPLQLNDCHLKSGMEVDNQKQPSGLYSPIRYAKVNDLSEPPTATHFASAYIMSPPKVDKKIHMFDFAYDDDKEIKILFNKDDEDLVSDHELDTFVSEIQRSFSATPIAIEAISVNDLQPPEFFRSVSRNEDQEEDFELITIDDTCEEHDVVTANIFQKKSASQVCTVSKPKVMNRNSSCPQNLTLKQQAVSNLEVLTAFSARDKSPVNQVQPGSVFDKDAISTCSIQAVPAPNDLAINMIGAGATKIGNETEKISSSFNAKKSFTAKMSTHGFNSGLTKLESLSNTSKADEVEIVQSTISTKTDNANVANGDLKFPNEDFASMMKSDDIPISYTKGPNSESITIDETPHDSDEVKTADLDLSDNQPQKDNINPAVNETVSSANEGTFKLNEEFDGKKSSYLDGAEATPKEDEANLSDNWDAIKVEGDGLKSESKSVSFQIEAREISEREIESEDLNSSLYSTKLTDCDQIYIEERAQENCDSAISDKVKTELKSDVSDLSASQADEVDAEFKIEESQMPVSSEFDDISSKFDDNVKAKNELQISSESKIPLFDGSADLKAYDRPEGEGDQLLECNIQSSETKSLNDDGDTASVVAASSPQSPSKTDPPPAEGVGGTGLVYTAEVKVVQPSGQHKSQVFQSSAASAAPAAFATLAPVANPPAPAVPLSQPMFTAPAATKPAPVVTKPVPSPAGLGGLSAQGTGFVSQAEAEERRKSVNFNLAANGWGNYNKYYRPISFAS